MYIDVSEYDNEHQMGKYATRPIAPVLTRPALLLLLAWSVVVAASAALQLRPTPCGWNDHAASSRLAGQAKTDTLRHVQLRFLG